MSEDRYFGVHGHNRRHQFSRWKYTGANLEFRNWLHARPSSRFIQVWMEDDDTFLMKITNELTDWRRTRHRISNAKGIMSAKNWRKTIADMLRFTRNEHRKPFKPSTVADFL